MEPTNAQAVSVERVELCCRECATRFAIDAEALAVLKDRRMQPRCPFGHGTWMPAATIAGALRDQVDQLQREVKWEKDRREEARAAVKQLEHRVAGLIGANKRLRALLERSLAVGMEHWNELVKLRAAAAKRAGRSGIVVADQLTATKFTGGTVFTGFDPKRNVVRSLSPKWPKRRATDVAVLVVESKRKKAKKGSR